MIAAGLTLLIVSGEMLVRGASNLAATMGISPLVIGLTVVAFGTSAPELAVALQSVLAGKTELAMGNIVGSNIANILLILGLSALVSPLIVASQLIRLDVPVMITANLAVIVLAMDGVIGRWDGFLLFSALLFYTSWLIRQSRKASRAVHEEFKTLTDAPEKSEKKPSLFVQVGLVVVGILLLGVGAHLLVGGAVKIARLLGVNELVIGLTVVAVGTSLPEIVTSIMASIRGHRDIAVGNVVGSNLFNILCVLGLSSIFAPAGIAVSEAVFRFDLPIMIAVSFACLPIFFTGNRVARWEGGLFFGYYLAYTSYLVLAALQADVTRTFGVILIGFVIPLTAITVLIFFARSVRNKIREKQSSAESSAGSVE